MSTYKSSHQCQIDCTNHDQVINNLELKSKDLYYFWRNYEWLYNKYYNQQQSQPQPTTKQPEPQISTRQMQQEISRLSSQNKRLKIDNQSFRKQIQTLSSGTGNKGMQNQLRKQIDRLNEKCKDYENIRQSLTNQITNMKQKLRGKDQEYDDMQAKYKRQIKKQEAVILQLQKSIDELRAKNMQGGSNNAEQIMVLQEKYRRQIQKMQILMRNIEQKANQIVEEEFQLAKQQLLREFPQIIAKFSQGDLSSLIIQQVYDQQ